MAERTRCSTRALKADQAFCEQVARLLFTDAEPIQRAFLNEPVKEVLALVEWAMEHEDDPGFEAGRALEAWAKKRRRGCYGQPSESPEDGHGRPVADRTPHPDTTASPRQSESRRGLLVDPARLAQTAEKLGV